MPKAADAPRELQTVRNVKCYEHRDLQSTAMSVDYTGEFILLAGRRHLALQQKDGTLRRYTRNSKYEVSAAEFAICSNRHEYCAIASSQNIDVVTWGTAEPIHLHSLRGHTRTVTDIDWHGQDSNLLASCSIDTFSHIWDLRDPKKPTLSLNAVCMSGATQVGFNRVSGHLLAAAHDGDLRIWDIRRGSCPIHYITAHLNRVHGINWSHRRETCLATASQDGTVKYFDVNYPRRTEKIIKALSPVWRARYTPIGNGLVTIVLPSLGRGDNSLLLWSNSYQTHPVCSFVGHTDVILDFAWRPTPGSCSEIEVVTWSRDRTLRVWKIDETMLKLCEPDLDTIDNYDTPDVYTDVTLTNFQLTHSSSLQQPTLRFHHTTSVATAASLPTEAIDALQIAASRSPPLPYLRRAESHIARSLTDQPTCSLHHEFSLLNTNMPHVKVDTLDAIKRYALFHIFAGGYVVVLQTTFPTEYPSPNVAPDFTFCTGSNLNDNLSSSMLKVLRTTALQRVKRLRTCLEQCLRALVTALKKSSGGSDKSQLRLQSPRLEGALSALHDACIPFPRTSGVKFNQIGILITFAQTLNTKRLHPENNVTPRTLSAIALPAIMQPVLYAHRDSNASFYLQDRLSSKHSKNRSLRKPTSATHLVHIYEASKLLNISRKLAQELSLDKRNLTETCRKNRQACEANGRFDLCPIWTLAEAIATAHTPNESRYETLFYKDPFKKLLLKALIMHFAHAGDLQTAVMLACLFHKCTPTMDMQNNTFTQSYNSKLTQLSHRIQASEYAATQDYRGIWTLEKIPTSIDYRTSYAVEKGSSMHPKQHRSYSWSDALDCVDSKETNNSYSCSLIRRSEMPLFDNFKMTYADILFGWQLITKRALILKHTLHAKPMAEGVEFMTQCSGCSKIKRTAACGPCKRPVLNCVLCCLPVKGSANACMACGHGGHLTHMRQWFQKHNICATGCGCHCLKETSSMLHCID